VLLQDQSRLNDELTEVKEALAEEKVLNAKRHEDLLSILSALKRPNSLLLLFETSLPPVPYLVLSPIHSLISLLVLHTI